MVKSIVFQDNVIYYVSMVGIDSRMYLIIEENAALIVDPHISEETLKLLHEFQVQEITVLLTHEHFDHISGVNWLRKCFEHCKVICTEIAAYNLSDLHLNMAPLFVASLMNKDDETRAAAQAVADMRYTCTSDLSYSHEMDLVWHTHTLKLYAAPGHSQGGSLIVFDEGLLFSGDNLVNGKEVITRYPGGNKKDYTAVTQQQLIDLPDTTYVCPGHGDSAFLKDLRQYYQVKKSSTDNIKIKK